jgi:hypothetical protein
MVTMLKQICCFFFGFISQMLHFNLSNYIFILYVYEGREVNDYTRGDVAPPPPSCLFEIEDEDT